VRALLIGCGRYRHLPDVPCAGNGAAALGSILATSPGALTDADHVSVLLDPTLEEAAEAIVGVLRLPGRDVLLLLSGHCLRLDDDEVFALGETEWHNEERTGLTMSWLATRLTTGVRANRVAVILDCCHSKGLAVRLDLRNRSRKRIVSILASCDLHETAAQGKLLSPFMDCLLGELLRHNCESNHDFLTIANLVHTLQVSNVPGQTYQYLPAKEGAPLELLQASCHPPKQLPRYFDKEVIFPTLTPEVPTLVNSAAFDYLSDEETRLPALRQAFIRSRQRRFELVSLPIRIAGRDNRCLYQVTQHYDSIKIFQRPCITRVPSKDGRVYYASDQELRWKVIDQRQRPSSRNAFIRLDGVKVPCLTCHGKGWIDEPCETCRGDGTVRSSSPLLWRRNPPTGLQSGDVTPDIPLPDETYVGTYGLAERSVQPREELSYCDEVDLTGLASNLVGIEHASVSSQCPSCRGNGSKACPTCGSDRLVFDTAAAEVDIQPKSQPVASRTEFTAAGLTFRLPSTSHPRGVISLDDSQELADKFTNPRATRLQMEELGIRYEAKVLPISVVTYRTISGAEHRIVISGYDGEMEFLDEAGSARDTAIAVGAALVTLVTLIFLVFHML
jgi:hypothetical protein